MTDDAIHFRLPIAYLFEHVNGCSLIPPQDPLWWLDKGLGMGAKEIGRRGGALAPPVRSTFFPEIFARPLVPPGASCPRDVAQICDYLNAMPDEIWMLVILSLYNCHPYFPSFVTHFLSIYFFGVTMPSFFKYLLWSTCIMLARTDGSLWMWGSNQAGLASWETGPKQTGGCRFTLSHCPGAVWCLPSQWESQLL